MYLQGRESLFCFSPPTPSLPHRQHKCCARSALGSSAARPHLSQAPGGPGPTPARSGPHLRRRPRVPVDVRVREPAKETQRRQRAEGRRGRGGGRAGEGAHRGGAAAAPAASSMPPVAPRKLLEPPRRPRRTHRARPRRARAAGRRGERLRRPRPAPAEAPGERSGGSGPARPSRRLFLPRRARASSARRGEPQPLGLGEICVKVGNLIFFFFGR